ncbi:MAG TPA: hypothetical protein VF761_07225 [Gemmatimonadaceae bacterium]
MRLATVGSVFDRGGTGTVAQATVPFTVTNRGDETVFVPGCGGQLSASIERGVGDHWEQYSGGFCLAVNAQAPIALRAGQRLTSEFPFYEPGYYRIRISWGMDASAVYGDDSVVSNAFTIR